MIMIPRIDLIKQHFRSNENDEQNESNKMPIL
jgi:hypothetical protein